MTGNYLRMALAYLVLIALVILALLPIGLGVITAFKPELLWIASPPVWNFTPTLASFRHVLVANGHLSNLISSLVVSFGSVAIAMLLGVPAAYSLARFRFSGSQVLLSWLISLRMVPPVVVAVPFYVLFLQTGLRNTYVGLILANLALAIPLAIWIMRGYFAELPSAMEESAMIDGCNRLDALRRVVLPLVTPGILATALIVLIFTWNEYLLALILTGRETQTLPVAAGTYVGLVRVEWGNLFAINTVIMAPVIILAIILQRQLLRGLTFGMLK